MFAKTADIILISSNVTCSHHDIEDGTHTNIIVFDCMESTIYHDQVDQELLTLPEHLSLSPIFNGVRVTRSLVLYVCFVDRCLSFFLLAIVFSVLLRYADSDYPFGIFKLF